MKRNNLPFPRKASLEITENCQLRCKHCSVSTKRENLTPKEWKIILEKLVKEKVYALTLSGGEPFIYQDFWLFLELVDALPFRYDINSNGLLLEEAEIKKIKKLSSKFTGLKLSLDGFSEEVNDAVRGAGTFKKTIRVIEKLLRSNVNFFLQYTINAINLKDFQSFEAFQEEYGVKIHFVEVFPSGKALDFSERLLLNTEERKIVYDFFRNYIKEKSSPIISGSMFSLLEFEKKIENKLSNKGKVSATTSCRAIFEDFVVCSDGEVIPCDKLREYKLGNLLNKNFNEILKGEKTLFFLNRLKFKTKKLPFCVNCEINEICGAGCPAVLFNLTGALYGADISSCMKKL